MELKECWNSACFIRPVPLDQGVKLTLPSKLDLDHGNPRGPELDVVVGQATAAGITSAMSHALLTLICIPSEAVCPRLWW